MRTQLLLLLAVLWLPGCGQVLEPLPAGRVELEVALEPQQLVIDGRGHHLKINGLVFTVAAPSLSGQEADAWHIRPLHLRDDRRGRRQALAEWHMVEGTVLELDLGATGGAATPSGAGLEVAGVYNGLLSSPELNHGGFVLPLRVTIPLRLEMPELDTSVRGRRLRLVLDPGKWFLDPDTDRLVPIEGLLSGPGKQPDHLAQKIAKLAQEQIRLELID